MRTKSNTQGASLLFSPETRVARANGGRLAAIGSPPTDTSYGSLLVPLAPRRETACSCLSEKSPYRPHRGSTGAAATTGEKSCEGDPAPPTCPLLPPEGPTRRAAVSAAAGSYRCLLQPAPCHRSEARLPTRHPPARLWFLAALAVGGCCCRCSRSRLPWALSSPADRSGPLLRSPPAMSFPQDPTASPAPVRTAGPPTVVLSRLSASRAPPAHAWCSVPGCTRPLGPPGWPRR